MAVGYSSQSVDGENVGRAKREKKTKHAKDYESREADEDSVLTPYSAAKTEHGRNFCRKDESCDMEGAIEGTRGEKKKGTRREGNCDRKEGNWSGKRAPLVVAFSDNSRRTF